MSNVSASDFIPTGISIFGKERYTGPKVGVGNVAWMPENTAASDGQTVRTALLGVGNTTTIADPVAWIANANTTHPSPNYRFDQPAASSITVTGSWHIPVATVTVASSTNSGFAVVTVSGSPGWTTNQWNEVTTAGAALNTYRLGKITGASTENMSITANTSNTLTLGSVYSSTAPAAGDVMAIYRLVQWTWSGATSVTLTSGQVVSTDPINAVIPYGGAYGQQLMYTVCTTVPTTSTVFDYNVTDNDLEAVYQGIDRTFPTSGSWGTGKFSYNGLPGPACVRLVTAYDYGRSNMKSYPIALCGDSLTLGWKGTALNQNTIGYSALQRACLNAGVGYVNFGAQGETAQTASTDYAIRAQLFAAAGCKNAVIGYGRNDINLGSPPTSAQIEGYLASLYNTLLAAGIQHIAFMTIPPATTSTDSWVTTANQSTGTQESTRLAVNTWIRGGAGGLSVLPYVDLDAYVSVVRSSDGAEVWKPYWTNDGTHPLEGAIETMATCMDLSGPFSLP
jgi:hypothetical protein